MTLYKTMHGTAGAYSHGDYTGYMPRGKRPGKWLPKVQPKLCVSGYHYCRDLKEALAHTGPDLFEVEVRGAQVSGSDKAAAEQMRLLRRVPEWNERNLRHFACDCAESALEYAQDDQRELLQACIEVTRAYADWPDEWDAARAAAWDAAGAAAWDAARAAAWDAAWAAARAAAWAAAWDAAWDAQAVNLATYLDGTNEWCERGTQ